MSKAAIRIFVALTLVVWAGPAASQQSLLTACSEAQVVFSPIPPPVQDQRQNVERQFRFLCGQVVSAMANVQPTVGIAFSGGAHTLGTATTLGRRATGFPRIAVTARLNAALADVPDLLDGHAPTFDQAGQLGPMGTVGLPVASLQGDAALGVFNGVSLGPIAGGLGALDLLASAAFIPPVSAIGLDDPIVNLGVGARAGILRQGLILPGISVSGMYRTMLGDVGFGSIAAGDAAEFTTGLSTVSLRGAVSHSVLMLNLVAGGGYDVYTSRVRFDVELDCPAQHCTVPTTVTTADGVGGELRTAAWNVFGNVGLNFLVLNLVGEVGYQRATDVVDAASLRRAGLPDRAPTREELEGGRFFISLGARLSL